MATCVEVAARTLRELGVRQMYGLPGGEILAFIEAARREGIDFLLVRDEATAAFMADVQGQVERRPGICVSTLGPGAMNMALGVANAFLDRSPVLAVTAELSTAAAPYATHQRLDLGRIYAPFTRATFSLDGVDTRGKVEAAWRAALGPRMGPVYLGIPRDMAGVEDRESGAAPPLPSTPPGPQRAGEEAVAEMVRRLGAARRPVLVVGLDLDPRSDRDAVLRFVDRMGVPVFATPKAKGIVPEDHPLFGGVCAGVAGDSLIVEFLEGADLLVGLGFEPVESDKLWHHTLPMVNVGPVSIADGAYTPLHEVVGDVPDALDRLGGVGGDGWGWGPEELPRLREALEARLRPRGARDERGGISPFHLTRALRDLLPRETVHLTDVGSVKYVTSQAWTTYEPLSFFESNGLSSMGYAFPGAMAIRRLDPHRPILCTVGDGGFGMTLQDLETCVRARLPFLTVVYNDSSLSLIRVAQEFRGYPNHGVDFGPVDFAAVARGFGAWATRIQTLEELGPAVEEALASGRPAVIDAVLDPREYRDHAR
jgi:acetolactate synthase I/II/III large subunit